MSSVISSKGLRCLDLWHDCSKEPTGRAKVVVDNSGIGFELKEVSLSSADLDMLDKHQGAFDINERYPK